MIWTDSQGSVWISGQLVCRDAFPQQVDTFWLPLPNVSLPWLVSGVPGSGGIFVGSGIVGTTSVVSGSITTAAFGYPFGCSPDPDVVQLPPNPFYHGYDSLE